MSFEARQRLGRVWSLQLTATECTSDIQIFLEVLKYQFELLPPQLPLVLACPLHGFFLSVSEIYQAVKVLLTTLKNSRQNVKPLLIHSN